MIRASRIIWQWTMGLLFMSNTSIFTQDTLSMTDIKDYHYTFDIIDGKLVGTGADLLRSEFKKHQAVLLGEFHGMKSISEFTAAIVPILDKEGFNHFGLEVGPTMGKVLDTISADHTISVLNKLNKKYVKYDEDYTDTPIPFFDNIEDANFLKAANELEMNIFGVDQEFVNSYPMLLDIMFERLGDEEQSTNRRSYQTAMDSISSFYQRELNNDEDYTTLIHESKAVQSFLDILEKNSENVQAVSDFRKSLEIYNYNHQRKWSTNYSTRMDYMKQMFKREVDQVGFNFDKDKLLIKMGRLHLSRGVSSYGYHEIGNTIRELAEFNGKTALGIGFETRYEIENDTIRDALNSENKWVQKYYGFRQFGDLKKWVILDLKGIRQGFYWYPSPLSSKINAALEKIIENYDILIIPPAYPEPTPNY